jgi:hypothetical protein
VVVHTKPCLFTPSTKRQRSVDIVSARSPQTPRGILASSRYMYTLHPHRDGTDERCRAVTARMIAMPMFVATSRHLRLLRPSLAWLGEHLERSDCLVSLCLLNVTCSRFLIAARSCHVLRRDDFEELALEEAPCCVLDSEGQIEWYGDVAHADCLGARMSVRHVELEARVAEHAGASSVVDCEARFSRVATCREAPAYFALHALLRERCDLELAAGSLALCFVSSR